MSNASILAGKLPAGVEVVLVLRDIDHLQRDFARHRTDARPQVYGALLTLARRALEQTADGPAADDLDPVHRNAAASVLGSLEGWSVTSKLDGSDCFEADVETLSAVFKARESALEQPVPTLAPTHWTSNGEAGDGQNTCDVCGADTDEGHTHADCYKAGEDVGDFAGFHRALELVSKGVFGEWDGCETLDQLVARLKGHAAAREQPVPTGEVTEAHWSEAEKAVLGTVCGREYVAGYARGLANGEVRAFQAGRESARGGWVAPTELHGVAGYLRAELEQFGSARSYRVERALRMLESVLPPPPSDPSEGGG